MIQTNSSHLKFSDSGVELIFLRMQVSTLFLLTLTLFLGDPNLKVVSKIKDRYGDSLRTVRPKFNPDPY